MRKLRVITIAAMLLSSCMPLLLAQDQDLLDYLAESARKYGQDADLVNGEKYFYLYTRSDGDPFLNSETQLAMLRVRGKEFAEQQLRYDIFNQQLILEYEDVYGGMNSLVLRDEWVEWFSYMTRTFRKMEGPDGVVGYYQIVHEGTVSCYYRWRKQYLLNLNMGVQNYYFTEPSRNSYLYMNEAFILFRNNGGFVKSFPKKNQKAIKKLLKQSKIKVMKVSDANMRHLLKYCNSLVDETD